MERLEEGCAMVDGNLRQTDSVTIAAPLSRRRLLTKTLYFLQPLTLTNQEINPNGSYPIPGERKDNAIPSTRSGEQWKKKTGK